MAARDAGARAAPETRLLTASEVDAYVAFQKRVLALLGQAQRDARGYADGGVAAQARLFAALKVRAQQEDAARRESGLGEAEIEMMDRLSQAVLAKRAFAKSFDYDAQIRQFQRVREKLPEAERARVEETLAALQRQKDRVLGLTEERDLFGGANVDLMLVREAELERTYEATLELLGGPSKLPSGG